MHGMPTVTSNAIGLVHHTADKILPSCSVLYILLQGSV